MRKPAAGAAEPSVPTALSPAVTGIAGFRREAVEGDRHDAVARGAAMLDARDHLLADVAALVEIDAAELVHVGLVRKGVAIDEIEAAARHAERDAMRLVVGGSTSVAPRSAAASAARCGGSMQRMPSAGRRGSA